MKALITIFDEDTGRVFVKDKLIKPSNMVDRPEFIATRYDFGFSINIAKDPPIPTYSDEILDKRTEKGEK